MYMKPDVWLRTIRSEYLCEFIPSGGAAIKFAVLLPDVAGSDFSNALQEAARKEGFDYYFLDGASTRLHMIDQIFHSLARQVDWKGLAINFLLELFKSKQYAVPSNGQGFSFSNLASMNHRNEGELKNDTIGWLESTILGDFSMSHEFRVAMLRLCRAELEPDAASTSQSELIIQWLRGDLRHIAQLKNSSIFQRIARHNARHILFSLVRWLRVVGRKGLVLHIDISRYAVKRVRSIDQTVLHYSVAATLDLYEVLRQFVDATDEVEGLFMVVTAGRDFIADETRGLKRYPALRMRIWDDIRDRYRTNPFAPLTRLSRESFTSEVEALL